MSCVVDGETEGGGEWLGSAEADGDGVGVDTAGKDEE